MKNFIFALTCVAANAALAEDMSGASIQSTLAGAQLRGTTATGQPYTTTIRANGTVRGVSGFDNQFSDNGRWSVEGDRYCIQYETWLNGEKFCSTVAREGDVIAFTETDSQITTYAVLSR